MLDEKQKFNKLVEDRLELDSDKRRGLREAILTNQTLKALAYIELIFDEMDKDVKEDEAVTETKKATTKPASTRPKKTEEKPETNDEDSKS